MFSAELSTEQLEQFAVQGFLVVRQCCAEALREELLDAAQHDLAHAIPPLEYEADLQYPGAPASREVEGGRTIRRLRQMTGRDPVFLRWAFHPILAGYLRRLFGVDEIRLSQAHHNSLMSKHPYYSSQTHWHRDIRYWNFADSNLISVWLALGNESRENGGLGFLPGSHRLKLEEGRYEERAFLRADLPENQALIAQAVYPTLAPGDVVFFHAMTLHAASWNRTAHTKCALVYTYHRADNLPTPGTRSTEIAALRVP